MTVEPPLVFRWLHRTWNLVASHENVKLAYRVVVPNAIFNVVIKDR